jgi:hypothetical protein
MPYYKRTQSTTASTETTTAAAGTSTVAVVLRRRDVAIMRRDIQHYFTGDNGNGSATPIFDYCEILTRILRSCSHVLAHHLPHLPNLKEELDKVYSFPIHHCTALYRADSPLPLQQCACLMYVCVYVC